MSWDDVDDGGIVEPDDLIPPLTEASRFCASYESVYVLPPTWRLVMLPLAS